MGTGIELYRIIHQLVINSGTSNDVCAILNSPDASLLTCHSGEIDVYSHGW